MIFWITIASLLLALIPALLFLRNLALYVPLPKAKESPTPCSVLIPARDEEENIADSVRSALASEGIEMEVVVLDDGSTDRTAEIVRELAASDSRVRLETAGPLPPDWCGKPHACFQLSALARHPLLLFIDADVRISRPDSLARLSTFVEKSGVSLVSGIPREKTESFLERLVIPLIHFVLLGFLPIKRMRNSTDPRYAAACGQIMALVRDDYELSGGHATIPTTLHDGVELPRSLRGQGFGTDLFDATDTFSCHMYQGAKAVWKGFTKNAHEGLGSPRLILPATIMLFGGQILPFLLLAFSPSWLALSAVLAAYAPRFLAAIRFQQSLLGAILHPVGIAIMLAIQWTACFRSLADRPAVWKGREYTQAPVEAQEL